MPVTCMPFHGILTALAVFAAVISCQEVDSGDIAENAEDAARPALPSLEFKDARLFPSDGSLNRAEDGLSLEDGRVIVVDQATGLRVVQPDGTNRAFGDFASAGFVNAPETLAAAPNGIALGNSGEYVWMSDVLTGKIYRVNIVSESVEVIYDHPFGVNTLTFDAVGNIWFTQSTDNGEGPADPNWLSDLDTREAHGAVYRLNRLGDGYADTPQLILDGLHFANGITFGNSGDYLYVAETVLNRILRMPVDSEGRAGQPAVFAYVATPDNIKFDRSGNLWVASPITNQVVAVSPDGRHRHAVFRAESRGNRVNSEAFMKGMLTGEAVLHLLNADLVEPLPGLLTGMFFSPDESELYISNLGNALVRLKL